MEHSGAPRSNIALIAMKLIYVYPFYNLPAPDDNLPDIFQQNVIPFHTILLTII